MEPHSVETWETILGRLPSPEGLDTSRLCAERIAGDLVAFTYKITKAHRDRDIRELTNALIAFARLHAKAGVIP